MLGWLGKLFERHESIASTWDYDKVLTIENAVGGAGIFLLFLAFGVIFIAMADKTPHPSKAKTLVSKMIGWSFILCAISRAVEVIAIWEHYPHMVAMLRNATWAVGACAAILLPAVVKEALYQRTIEDVHKKMEDTSAKLEEVKKISTEVNIK